MTRTSPDTRWLLFCFSPPPPDFPADAHVIVSDQSLRMPALLWLKALFRRLDRIVVCCDDVTRRSALETLILFASVTRGSEKALIDGSGREEDIATPGARAFLAFGATPVLLLLSRLVTRVGLRIWTRDPVDTRGPDRLPGTAILVPILPDLSHTFVYREALELARRHPEYSIFSLETGDASVIHREAKELLGMSEPIPRPSPQRYLLSYLSAWCRSPRSMSALIRFFRPYTASFAARWHPHDDFCFLRMEHLHHPNYVMLGFVLGEFLRSRRIGYVHVYGSTYPALRMLVAHRWLGIPFSVSTFVDFDYETPFHLIAEKFGSARFTVACTQFCADRLVARLPQLQQRFRVLRHAIRADYAGSAQLRPSDGRSRLVFVGRFVAKKGLDTLVRACAALRGKGCRFTCHLYGSGPERAPLEALITGLGLDACVFLEAPIPNERFYSVMNRDDIFVCASRYLPDGDRDGIPVTLLEAMAAGITVVSTAVSGIPELIDSGRNGYLVAPDDPQQLGDLLGTLLTDADTRSAVADAAVRTIQDRFTLETSIDALDEWITRETGSESGAAGLERQPVRGRT